MNHLPLVDAIAAGVRGRITAYRGSRWVVFLGLAVGLWPARATSAQEIDKSMTVKQAINIIDEELRQANRVDTPPCVGRLPLQGIKITKDGFQYVDRGKRDLGFWTHSADSRYAPYWVVVSFRFKEMPFLQVGQGKQRWPTPTMTNIHNDRIRECVGWAGIRDVTRFAMAVNRLIWENSAEGEQSRCAEEAAFERKVAEWRATAEKPTMPENAREHKVLAENAVQEKNFAKAIQEYEAALKVFPTWPEGQFNLALLYGETGEYENAVEHMEIYLMLLPDAPDAQAAKDKVIIWRDKLAHP